MAILRFDRKTIGTAGLEYGLSGERTQDGTQERTTEFLCFRCFQRSSESYWIDPHAHPYPPPVALAGSKKHP